MVVPRVLVVRGEAAPDTPEIDRPALDVTDVHAVQPAVAPDGDTALALLRRERFDAVVVDLGLAPIDGWCLLAAVGSWSAPERPRVIAVVTDWSEIARARSLGADLCVAAGTPIHARALVRSTKEITCPRPPPTDFPTPTKVGASA